MQSSATVALRAFIMLACAVGIPVLAMSGASWSEILKKFQNLRWPAIVEFASASTPAAPPSSGEKPPFSPSRPAELPPARPNAILGGNNVLRDPSSASPVQPAVFVGAAETPSNADDIPKRLQQLGATYYVLEAWGNGEQLYRFYCKMAVVGSADYAQCFEATDSDPQQAMRRVLRQVEAWRETTAKHW
jgi:hypothetical protein